MKMKFFIERAGWGRAFHLHIGSQQGEKFAVMEPAQFRVISEIESTMMQQAALELSTEDGQALIDELWHAGFRPTEGTGSAGAMAATQAHLKDLQRLVFDRPTGKRR